MLLCFIFLSFKLVSIIGKVSDYELFIYLLIDIDMFSSFQGGISMVKTDRS